MTSLERNGDHRPVCALLLSLLLATAAATELAAAPYLPPPSNRSSVGLSGNWKFIKADAPGSEAPGFDDSTWRTVSVPHTWNNVDGQDGPNSGGGAFGREYYRGIGTYRRHVTVPASYTGRRMFLQFDGAALIADVWVNGNYVGQHQGGFTLFRFEVTAFLNTAPGNDNVITVKVNNSNYSAQIPPLAGDFTIFGGLYRDVSLVATDQVSVDMLDFGSPGVYLSQPAVTAASATLRIKTRLANATSAATTVTVRSVIADADANVVQTVTSTATLPANSTGTTTQNVTVAEPRLWDGVADPYLYSVHVEVREGGATGPVRDVVPPQPLGFRSYSLDPNQGFTLNGRYLDLHGVNRHQDRLNKGWAISQRDQDEDMSLIKEIGATAVRLAHYPHAPYFYGLTDRNGLVVWAEIPVIDRVGDQAFSVSARQQLIEMIRQHYNHPSIIFWGVANEVRYPPDPNSLLAELHALAKQEDPYRITTLAHCCVGETDPIANQTDTVGYNKYLGWYEWNYNAFGYWADVTHTNTPAKTFSISEYGAGGSVFLHAQNPPLSFSNHTEEYQALFHEAHWLAMKTRPFIWGKFVWNMFDFASDGRTEGDTDGRNDKGLVTYDRRTRKDAFYWYQANWTTAPMVYITSRRWTQRTAANTEVKIYSNADTVTLVVNGVSLGTIAAADRIFRWTDVTLRNGLNTVQAIGSAGAVTVTDTVNWNVGTPRVTIASPSTGDTFVAPASFTLTASAIASLAKVEFFAGTTKIGEDVNGSDGWSVPWANVPVGSYILTARSTDSAGAATMSPDVRITVEDGTNQFPSVSVASPANGARFSTGSNIPIVASASDSDGTIEKVTFFQGTTKVAEDSNGSDGWTATLLNVPLGVYTLTTRATDNLGASKTSAPVTVTVDLAGNLPPTVAVPALATPAIVTGTSTTLSVLGADDGGEPNLTYTWTTTGTPPAPVSFSANGTNAARNTVASFARPGSYAFQVTVRDAAGSSATSNVAVSVTQTMTGIRVLPAGATVLVTATQPFSATATDQFTNAMTSQPGFAWSVSGGGTISSSGLFAAGSIPGTFSVSASAAGRSGSASVNVVASGGFSVNINFQPAAAPTFPGYLVDGGAAYADRGNGRTYGWSQDNTAGARDRNHLLSPDQRYDTLVHMGELTWEIAVPNGTYSVRAVLGDPSYPDVNARLTVEGVPTINGATNAVNPWLQGTGTVTVTDGRLTIGNQAGSYSKICFVEITAAAVNPNQPPSVGITSPAHGATFAMPATVTIAATAADSDGTVARVEFFDGTARLGEDTDGSDGWSMLWANVPAGTHSLTARATDNAAATATSSTVSFTVAALSVLRIDVGSTSGSTDSAGRAWQPDQFGSGGTVSSKPDPIGNTIDDNLYRTYRFGQFTYDIPVANGTYEVQVGFIETWWTGPGQRIFSVAAEGITTLANVDLYEAGGKFNAIDRTFSVDVTDGILSLAFTSSIDNAIVSTITITRLP